MKFNDPRLQEIADKYEDEVKASQNKIDETIEDIKLMQDLLKISGIKYESMRSSIGLFCFDEGSICFECSEHGEFRISLINHRRETILKTRDFLPKFLNYCLKKFTNRDEDETN